MRKRGKRKTDELVIQTVKSEMNIDIDVKDVGQTHWIGANAEGVDPSL